MSILSKLPERYRLILCDLWGCVHNGHSLLPGALDRLAEWKDQGRTVLLSSHLMSELEQTADHLVVIGAGRLLADEDVRAFIARHSQPRTRVRSPHLDRLAPTLAALGARLTPEAGSVLVEGVAAEVIGEVAAQAGVTLHELSPRLDSLEEVYTRTTAATVQYRGVAA